MGRTGGNVAEKTLGSVVPLSGCLHTLGLDGRRNTGRMHRDCVMDRDDAGMEQVELLTEIGSKNFNRM